MAYTTRIDEPIREFLALLIIGRLQEILHDSKKGDKKTMRAAFTLCKERMHKNKAILNATFGELSAFLPKIGAQGERDGGAAKPILLSSAVKKRRERESRDAPPPANLYRLPCAALSVCIADLGQAWPKMSPTRTNDCGKSRSRGKFGSPLLCQS